MVSLTSDNYYYLYPFWQKIEIAFAVVEVILTFALVHCSSRRESKSKWVWWWTFLFIVVAQWALGDLSRLVNYAIHRGPYPGIFSDGQFVELSSFVTDVIAPILKGIIAIPTVVEEYYTAKYAHMLYNNNKMEEGGEEDVEGIRTVPRADKVVPFTLLGILLLLYGIGLTFVWKKTAKWYLGGRGEENVGRGMCDKSGEEGVLVLFAVVVLVMVLCFDIYQERYRVKHGEWKGGVRKARAVNLRITAYGVAVWGLLVVWLIIFGLPNYFQLHYVAAMTTLGLPALGVMTELYKIGRYGFGSTESFEA